jgi:phenylalanyl-tRNA synthetase alpha chain
MFASNYLGSEVDVQFRPSFFPFTEPSVEADYHWNDGWVEFGGAGMVDPNVLRDVGYDPEEYIGFAFGLGVERLCMRRHNITDIREFYRNDVRFLSQF